MSLEPARFDWYAASVDMPGDDLAEALLATLGDEPPAPLLARNGFSTAVEIRRGGCRAALLQWGGCHDRAHVIGSGADAPAVARFCRQTLRAHAVSHTVARADVCVDTDSTGAYGALRAALRACAREHRAKGHTYVPNDPRDGETTYIGSKTSEVTARLYEKGKQLPKENRPDWVRYEVQFKPQKGRKEWAATASASDLLGAARWSRAFAAEVLGVAAAAPPARSQRVSDLEGAIATMCGQYGNRLLELFEFHGGDLTAFGLELLTRAEQGGLLLDEPGLSSPGA